MEPADAVKLLYQASFGPGHMISDPSAALERTCRELESVTDVPALPGDGTPVFEEIGGGYARLYLNSRLNPALITRLFTASANAPARESADFVQSLNLLRRLTKEGVFGFSANELEKYLAENGIGTVKHYPIPMHMQGAYADLGISEGQLPIAEEISKTILSLPMYYGMTDEQIDYVIDVINKF